MKKKLIVFTALGLFVAGGAVAQNKPVTERERAERKERVKQNLKEAGEAVKETAQKAGTAIGKGADKAAEAIETETDKIKARQRERRAENEAKRDTL